MNSGSAALHSCPSPRRARRRLQTGSSLARGRPAPDQRSGAAVPTFEEAARWTHAELSPTWNNPKDRAKFLTLLETYMFPTLGRMKVSEVTSAHVRQAILAAKKIAPSVARKLVFRASAIFKWAVVEGLQSDNPARADALALPRDETVRRPRKALPYDAVPGCLAVIHAPRAGLSTKFAIEFLVLTAGRTSEVRQADWSEINLDAAVWAIPSVRMKMKKLHRVPLSPRALEVLREASSLGPGSVLVFPGTKAGRPLSDMTLSKLVKEVGFDADVHGFRTSFRTWAQERMNFPREVAEFALAHVVGDAAERAYARSDLFEKRR